MTQTSTGNATTLPGGVEKFNRPAIWLHWLGALLVAALIATIWLRGEGDGSPQSAQLLAVHRSLGLLLWVVTFGRLVWLRVGRRRPALPDSIPYLQRLAARLNEFGLYFLLVLQPATGLAQSLLHGKPFRLLIGEMPAFFARDKGLEAFFRQVHALSAWLLLALISIHILAALHHHFIARDTVMKSMLPWSR